MEKMDIDKITRRIEKNSSYNIKIKEFDEYQEYIFSSFISISMCGYNTAIELLQSDIPYVFFVPRNRTEQLLRSEAFQKCSNIYWTRSSYVLKTYIEQAIDNKLPIKVKSEIKSDGALQTAKNIMNIVAN